MVTDLIEAGLESEPWAPAQGLEGLYSQEGEEQVPARESQGNLALPSCRPPRVCVPGHCLPLD